MQQRVDIKTMRPDIIQRTVEYWRSQRDGRKLPTRRAIDPVELADLLANLVLVEVLDGGRDYLHRIAGEAAASLLGADLMGRRLSEFNDDTNIDPRRNGLDIARTFKAPHMADFTPNSGTDTQLKIVFLPVARNADENEADFLLCAVTKDLVDAEAAE